MNRIKIAGLIPLSTVDWPGHLAAVAFLQGCPWRCVFCHNEAILDPRAPGEVSFSQVTDLLERRRGLLDGVVFSGGEPTMQPALVDAAREVRDRGFQVGLHTGGAYPARLRSLVGAADGSGSSPCLLSWVGLDFKAPPHLYSQVVQAPGPAWERFRESFAILARSGVDVEVRTTLTPGLCAQVENLVTAFADLTDEVGGPRALVLQKARADGAPASFAQTLPPEREWAGRFAEAIEKAQACGVARGVQVASR